MATGVWGTEGQPQPVRITFSWQVGINRQQSGFYLRNASGTGADPQAAAVAVQPWFEGQFKGLLGTVDTLLGVDAVNLVTKEGGSVPAQNVTGTGALGAAALPAFITCVVAMKGQLRTRQGQGRMIWPVRGETSTDAETLTPAMATVVRGIITDLATRFANPTTPGAWILCNVHEAKAAYTSPKTGKVRPALAASFYDVAALQLNTRLSYLGSRKAGVGA